MDAKVGVGWRPLFSISAICIVEIDAFIEVPINNYETNRRV